MEHPRTAAMRTMRAQRALAVALTIIRNPGVTSRELEQAFEFSYRTLERTVATARRAGIRLRSEDAGGEDGHVWASDGIGKPEPNANIVLVRWLRALENGHIDLTGLPENERVEWYRDVGKLMLVGTPPFLPHDHIDVVTRGRMLHFTVPQGRSIDDRREYVTMSYHLGIISRRDQRGRIGEDE